MIDNSRDDALWWRFDIHFTNKVSYEKPGFGKNERRESARNEKGHKFPTRTKEANKTQVWTALIQTSMTELCNSCVLW